MTTWELMKAPGVAIVICIYSHIILQALAFTASMFQFSTPKKFAITKFCLNSQPCHPIQPCPSRRIRLLSQIHLTGPIYRRRQPSYMDAPRLPIPAAQIQHRHRSADLLHRLAYRNGLLPSPERASPRQTRRCVLDVWFCCSHRRLWHSDVFCVRAALLERYCAKSEHVGYAERCGFDCQ